VRARKAKVVMGNAGAVPEKKKTSKKKKVKKKVESS
jgi:hypothetical protein